MESERIAKLEAWIREVEARLARHRATKGKWLRGFVVLAIVSFAGFVLGPWVGAACAFTGVMMAVFGVYTVLVREGDYERDLENARRDVERLRAGMR